MNADTAMTAPLMKTSFFRPNLSESGLTNNRATNHPAKMRDEEKLAYTALSHTRSN